ncbi:hypothetical protein [Halolamina salifodinae]|uniref:Uncharacterized protein n=1 Tax=Halolamina salifodinae TaxID=1202767 RepID=A0A8T4H210_9EURY|nr:hypothetical protein [Halolamina salifodinae]MBP1987328.1 hypothetical protein [Halolamina salifodinae]
MNGTEQLSLKDMTFLRAIRDINGSPERYASTAQGETPATATAITAATSLSEQEVTYRLEHPRLGQSGLVTVYEAGTAGDDSASLTSAELTEAGVRAIAAADDRTDTDDGHSRRPDDDHEQIAEMQEWEPADIDDDGTSTTERTAAGAATAATQPGAEPPEASRKAAASRATAATESSPTDEPDGDRLAALESRIEALEAAQTGSEQETSEAAEPERVDDIASEVASLRESTDRLASRLDDALDELDAIKESEYGALAEKRERQFETAVKSMVAFHQLATEVLDVRVENYEPEAGRADPERVAVTRNRIGDALGVGKQRGGADITLERDETDWPDPEEAARGEQVFGEDETNELDPEPESAAPDTGVYPPIAGDDDDGPETAATEEASEADPESDAPDTGVYPPIGGNREEDEEAEPTEAETKEGGADSGVPDTGVYPPIGGDQDEEPEDDPEGSLPASIRPGNDDDGGISETAAEESHVVDPIRSTDHHRAGPRLDIDAELQGTVRTAITEVRAAADDPYPAGEAYARIIGEAPVGDGPAAASDRSATGAAADVALDDDDD